MLEGLDGSGQSSQVRLLVDWLKKQGKEALATKEPTKMSPFSRKLRAILAQKEKASPLILQKLFIADRKWHLDNVIKPALEQGRVVVSDRYYFSTLAYGKADGLDEDWLIEANKEFLVPDIVFFLDARPAVCLKRIKGRGEPITLFEKEKKLEQVYQYYKYFLKKFENKTKIYYINGERTIEDVFENICRKLKQNKK